MPRCKALVRGGSRRCRRQALNGTGFCSIHGDPQVLRAGSTRPRSSRSSVRGRAPRAPTGITGASYPSHKGYYRTIRNTRFGVADIVRHVYTDKVGDLSRTVGTAAAVNTALAPVTPYMIGLGPKGVAARAALGIGGTLAISGPMQTLDMYRDALQFFRTGEIGGKRIYSHEYVTM